MHMEDTITTVALVAAAFKGELNTEQFMAKLDENGVTAELWDEAVSEEDKEQAFEHGDISEGRDDFESELYDAVSKVLDQDWGCN